MKRIFGIILLLVFFLMMWSDSTLWEDEKYAVYIIDGQARLGIKVDDEDIYIGRLEPEVVAVGSNDKFVVAQRRFRGGLLYFFIEKAIDHAYLNADEIIEVGYSKEDFEVLKKQYNFPEFSAYF